MKCKWACNICPGSGLSLFFSSPTVLEVVNPLATSMAAQEGEHFQLFSHTTLEFQRRKFLKEWLNGRHRRPSSLTDIMQNESLHLHLLLVLLLPLFGINNYSKMDPCGTPGNRGQSNEDGVTHEERLLRNMCWILP